METMQNNVITKKNPIMKRSVYDAINHLLCFLTLAGVMYLFFNWFWLMNVTSESMYPTLTKGTQLLVNKGDSTPRYDQIVVFCPDAIYPRGHGLASNRMLSENGVEIYVKRCVGLPGDTIAVHDGYLYRNGEKIVSDYTKDELIYYTMDEITLGEDEYFMMGDNRNNSHDSHVIGPINRENIIGVVIHHFDETPRS